MRMYVSQPDEAVVKQALKFFQELKKHKEFIVIKK